MKTFSLSARLGSALLGVITLMAACTSGNDSGGGLLDPNNPGGVGTGPTLTITPATQTNIPAGTSANYTAVLLGGDGKGVSATPVTLTVSNGIIATSSTNSTTDADGNLAFIYTARNAAANGQPANSGTPLTAPSTATLTATAVVSGKTLKASLLLNITKTDFVFAAPAANTKVPINTNQTLTLTWTSSGQPVVGQQVTVKTDTGVLVGPSNGMTATSLTLTTDSNGTVNPGIVSSKTGNAIVTATDSSGQLTATLALQFVGGQPAAVTLTAASPIASTGTSTITATVSDAGGNPVIGVTVNFNLLAGSPSAGSLSQTTATTDSKGMALTTYSANGGSGTAMVNAVAGSVTSSTQNIVVNP